MVEFLKPMNPLDRTQDIVLSGGGECGALLRSHDWSKSPLGDPAHWPRELRTLTGVLLGALQPMFVVWGPEQIVIYNDAYSKMCGMRHPAALGGPFRELWFDIWDDVEPIVTAAYEGRGTQMEDISFIMHRHGFPERAHFSFSYTPVRDERARVAGLFCACSETTLQVRERLEEAKERDRLYRMLELGPGAVAVLEGPEHIFRLTNRAYDMLIGDRSIVGLTVREALPEVEAQGFIDILDHVYKTGEPHVGENIEIDLQRSPSGGVERRVIDFVYQAMHDSRSRVNGILVRVLDVTEQRIAEQQQELRNRELSHRMKNQLAMVQAIVSQTMRNTSDNETARVSISERILALSRAHDLLLQGEKGRSTVSAIVGTVLDLHETGEEGQFEVAGPAVQLASRPAMSMSLILHELATNAVKYGALSVPTGRVSVTWEITGARNDRRFVLSWKEQGGPQVHEPERKGSGVRLIGAGFVGVSDCVVNLAFDAAGLRCEISAGLDDLARED